jgi:hypothetical protein
MSDIVWREVKVSLKGRRGVNMYISNESGDSMTKRICEYVIDLCD